MHEAAAALDSGRLSALGRAMRENHACLVELGLSTPEGESLCRMASDAGALGAKLTGSGGGGCVVALGEGTVAPILERWRAAGVHAFSAVVEAEKAEEP